MRIDNDAVLSRLTHPTGLTQLKCCNIIFLWGGHLVRPGRARCPSHKSFFHALL
ncbi:hypothetical protein FDUTEX481_06744 [Tolypothrix sp. PCC 7601]|nr:hypothetical protein FDUTEX481_06744 [Tolypothrix sp. PCC 7601]